MKLSSQPDIVVVGAGAIEEVDALVRRQPGGLVEQLPQTCPTL